MIEKPNRVSFFLPSGVANPLDKLSVQSFVVHGHPCDIYSYHRTQSPIKDCNYLNAEDILPRKHYLTLKHRPAYLERWFKWELVAHSATWVASTDMVCLRPLKFTQQPVFAYADNNHVCDDLFCCPSDHSIARIMLRRYRHPEYFPFDSMQKLLSLGKALFFPRSPVLRDVDAKWLSDNAYLSIYMLTRQEHLYLLAPSQFTPWKSGRLERLKSGETFSQLAAKLPLRYSHAVKLHRAEWETQIDDITPIIGQLKEALNT
jgi:hypothetical protein